MATKTNEAKTETNEVANDVVMTHVVAKNELRLFTPCVAGRERITADAVATACGGSATASSADKAKITRLWLVSIPKLSDVKLSNAMGAGVVDPELTSLIKRLAKVGTKAELVDALTAWGEFDASELTKYGNGHFGSSANPKWGRLRTKLAAGAQSAGGIYLIPLNPFVVGCFGARGGSAGSGGEVAGVAESFSL